MFSVEDIQQTPGHPGTASGNYQFESRHFSVRNTIYNFTRWEGGDWLVVGDELARGGAPGWRFSDGLLFFGGWKNEEEVDADNVAHFDNNYVWQGQFRESRKNLKKLPNII